MDMIKLRTGIDVPGPALLAVVMSFRWLIVTKPITAYEAIRLARDPDYALLAGMRLDLQREGFIDGDHMPETTRAILCAMATGTGGDMRYVNPVVVPDGNPL